MLTLQNEPMQYSFQCAPHMLLKCNPAYKNGIHTHMIFRDSSKLSTHTFPERLMCARLRTGHHGHRRGRHLLPHCEVLCDLEENFIYPGNIQNRLGPFSEIFRVQLQGTKTRVTPISRCPHPPQFSVITFLRARPRATNIWLKRVKRSLGEMGTYPCPPGSHVLTFGSGSAEPAPHPGVNGALCPHVSLDKFCHFWEDLLLPALQSYPFPLPSCESDPASSAHKEHPIGVCQKWSAPS